MPSNVPQAPTDDEIAVRFPDGVSLTFGMLKQGIHATRAPMLMHSWVHDAAQDAAEDAYLAMGDDPVDAWQGPHNLIRNHHLAAKPMLEICTDVPAIVCGSGPSLDAMLPQLRELQSKALIICAHSTLDHLVNAGITPHVCTPVERIGKSRVISVDVPRDTWYGGMPIIPGEPDLFSRHFLLTGPSPLYEWAGLWRDGFPGGSTTGTLAAVVAASLTTGPIYLVGMDMAGTHCVGFRHAEETLHHQILCVDGETRPTALIWLRNRGEYARVAEIRRVIQTSPFGAVIPGAVTGTLPDPASMSPFTFTFSGTGIQRREQVLVDRAKSLRNAWDGIITRIDAAQTMADIHVHSLCEEHATILAELFHSIYGQLSVVKRLGHKDVMIPWFKEAAGNTMRSMRGLMLEATRDL
jgi:hypothetical protein